MENQTLKKKIQVLEHAFVMSAGTYYDINLTQNLVPHSIYQVFDGVKYSLNGLIGMQENASFTDIITYWGNKLPQEEKEGFFDFLSIPNLLQHFSQGETHVSHKYWIQSVHLMPMLVEQHIFMYEDEENGDILALAYILDLTPQFKEEEHKKKLEEKQKILENNIEELNKEQKILDALSIDYTSVYYCDLEEDTMIALKQGDNTNAAVTETEITKGFQKYSFRIRYYYENFVVQDSAPDFIYKLSQEYLTEYLEQHQRFVYRFRSHPNPAGQQYFEVQIVRLPDTDGFKVVMGYRYIDDILAEQEKQKSQLENALAEARRANIAKTDFLRRMSHDIRTPINGIQGMIAIADRYPDNVEKLAECRKKVKEAAGFLSELVNNILDMNKLESGRVILENRSFNLHELLSEVNNITEMNGVNGELHMVFDSKDIRHTYLKGSPVHVKQILQNIAGNAVKYNKPGGSIHFSTEEIAYEDGRAVFKFVCADTGCGMSKEFLKHAFEPFAQERKNARTSYMGTGLGLPIVKELVELMEGKIQVESEPGVGTTFTITIPFEIDSDYKNIEIAENTEETGGLLGAKVLLAEDNELNMEIAKFILEESGIEVITANNGKEAVDAYHSSSEGTFDMIFMDIMMPVMDGLTATKIIRESNRTDAKTVPIIAMTANAFVEDKENSRAAGMNEHLSKPLDEKKMMEVIKKYILHRGMMES